MNAMQTAAQTKSPRTIGQLKQYLAELEAAWTEQDELYLGKFDDQGLYCDLGPQGIAHAKFIYYGEFGLIAFIDEPAYL